MIVTVTSYFISTYFIYRAKLFTHGRTDGRTDRFPGGIRPFGRKNFPQKWLSLEIAQRALASYTYRRGWNMRGRLVPNRTSNFKKGLSESLKSCDLSCSMLGPCEETSSWQYIVVFFAQLIVLHNLHGKPAWETKPRELFWGSPA